MPAPPPSKLAARAPGNPGLLRLNSDLTLEATACEPEAGSASFDGEEGHSKWQSQSWAVLCLSG